MVEEPLKETVVKKVRLWKYVPSVILPVESVFGSILIAFRGGMLDVRL